MERALKKPADFERFRGRLAKISTSEPVGEARFFEGRLAGFADGKVRMELKGKEARTVEVPLEAIRKANLVVEFSREVKAEGRTRKTLKIRRDAPDAEARRK